MFEVPEGVLSLYYCFFLDRNISLLLLKSNRDNGNKMGLDTLGDTLNGVFPSGYLATQSREKNRPFELLRSQSETCLCMRVCVCVCAYYIANNRATRFCHTNIPIL